MLFRRKKEEFLQEGILSSNGLQWKDIEIIADGKDLQSLKEKLHNQIQLHGGHQDYLKIEGTHRDQVVYYDVGRNRYIKTPLSLAEGRKIFYAEEALLLSVEDSHAYFYAPWDEYSLGAKPQGKLPLLFWGVEITSGEFTHPERSSFLKIQDLSKCINLPIGEGVDLSTKLYKGLGSTFLEECYKSTSDKELKLFWQLTKGQKQGDLDLYLHTIEGVSKEIPMESFEHLANRVMIKDDQGRVKWWLSKEKQYIKALPASAQGAYPVPLRLGENSKGERVCFWLLHQKDHLFDLIYEVEPEEKKRFKEIKFVSEAGAYLILESQEGIIYQVDTDFKSTIIGLDESILKSIKPSGVKAFLVKKDHAPVLSLRAYQDPLSKPLMSWYDTKEDRYYISHYKGHPKLSYQGTSKEGLGLVYDKDEKSLYRLEGIKGKDLDKNYSLNAKGAATIGILSKQDKLASGVKSALSDGNFLQIEDSESCLWRCDMKKSFSKWYLIGLGQDALKGRISSESLCEKIQKAKEGFSEEKKLKLEIPAFISLAEVGFCYSATKKLLLVDLQGKKAQQVELLGIEGTYGYLNLEDNLYQIPLKDSWQQLSPWPEKKVLGKGKIRRIGASLVLLEVPLNKEALALLRGIKDIKGVYLNAAQMNDKFLYLSCEKASQFKQKAPMILSLMEPFSEGSVRIYFDDIAGDCYEAFKEASDLVIGYGLGKRELVIRRAFEEASRDKVRWLYIQEGRSIRKRLTLGQMVGCIRALIESGAAHEGQRIKLKKVFEHMQQ